VVFWALSQTPDGSCGNLLFNWICTGDAMNIIELAKQAEFTDREIQITHDNFVRFAALVVAKEREAAITAIQNIERKGGWVTREDAIIAIKARGTT
jgi:hypothetical protein